VLKNSFALSCAPGSGAEHVVFVVFWTCFRALLESRPGRQPLFQQAEVFSEVLVDVLSCNIALVLPKKIGMRWTRRTKHSGGSHSASFLLNVAAWAGIENNVT
jgi:hypothetical protein